MDAGWNALWCGWATEFPSFFHPLPRRLSLCVCGRIWTVFALPCYRNEITSDSDTLLDPRLIDNRDVELMVSPKETRLHQSRNPTRLPGARVRPKGESSDGRRQLVNNGWQQLETHQAPRQRHLELTRRIAAPTSEQQNGFRNEKSHQDIPSSSISRYHT